MYPCRCPEIETDDLFGVVEETAFALEHAVADLGATLPEGFGFHADDERHTSWVPEDYAAAPSYVDEADDNEYPLSLSELPFMGSPPFEAEEDDWPDRPEFIAEQAARLDRTNKQAAAKALAAQPYEDSFSPEDVQEILATRNSKSRDRSQGTIGVGARKEKQVARVVPDADVRGSDPRRPSFAPGKVSTEETRSMLGSGGVLKMAHVLAGGKVDDAEGRGGGGGGGGAAAIVEEEVEAARPATPPGATEPSAFQFQTSPDVHWQDHVPASSTVEVTPEKVAPIALVQATKAKMADTNPETIKANLAASAALAAKEGREMTPQERLGLGSADVTESENRMNEMSFDFSFGAAPATPKEGDTRM
jgi:hypothetical protein